MDTKKGYFCNLAQIQVVLPEKDFYKDETNNWRIIGYLGSDGIQFRQKNEDQGDTIYAYFPIEGNHDEVAESIEDLILKWKTNKLIL